MATVRSGTSAATTYVWVQGRNQGWLIRFRYWLARKLAPPAIVSTVQLPDN